MIVLGLNGIENLFHDASATLIIENEIIASVEEERFNRNKHSNGVPTNAIKYCLKKAGISFSEIDHIGYYLDHIILKKTFVDDIVAHFGCSPSGLQYYVDAANNIAGLKEKLSRDFSLSSKTELHYLNHHLAHASSAYYISGFNEAAVLTIDGSGDRETSTLYYGDGPDLHKVCDFLVYPESLGFIYSVFAAHLGLGWISGPGKLMGLAGYGTPDDNLLEDIVCLQNDPYKPISVDLSFFDYYTGGSGFTQKGLDRFGPVRESGDPLIQKHCDLAASVQRMLEKAILHIVSMIPDLIPNTKNLCFGGGVALNVCANRRIIDSDVFENIFVTPPAYDGGTSLGCALYLNTKYTGHHNYKFDVYSGPNITKDYHIKETLDRFEDNITWQELSEEEICAAAAEDVSRNMIIGWAQGGMECGPRALGNRSIVANAMNPLTKDDLNNHVKKREGFRPYAPSVLDEYAGQWFDLPIQSPFMLFEAQVHQDKRALVPGIVHIDGTARPQTVTKKNNPLYYRLIKEFHDITGVPMVLNTSFNRHGEPVVSSPEEALCVLLETGMDALYMGNYRILKHREKYSERVYDDEIYYDSPPLPANSFEWAHDGECKDLILKVGSRYTEGIKIRRIMDFACGSNEEITQLAPEAEEYYFLDGKFLPPQKPRYFRFKQQAGARIPLPDNYLDVVTTNGSFDHLTQEDRIKAFLEIERVLRPGGLFLFACEYIDFDRSNGNVFEMCQKDPDIVGRNCQIYDNIDLHDICSKLNNLKICQADRSGLPDGRALRELATTDRVKYYQGKSKFGTEVTWGSFIVVFSKEIIGGKELFSIPAYHDELLNVKKELTGEKNMGDNGNNDYSSITNGLRDKWVEVPGTRQGRVFSSDMLQWPDDQLLSFWEVCKKETCVYEVRGWYRNLYKDMFRGYDIADVGPGVGLDGIFFAQNGANVTFVDIVKDNLKLLERICNLKGIKANYYYIDDFFNFKFEDTFDAFLFVGSLINAPFDFTQRQVNAMTRFLKPGGKVAMLAYPKERYEQSGAKDFAEFGKMTDGERTPWCEWYDDDKISALFGDDFKLEWSRDFGKDNLEFNWFDLTKIGNLDVNCSANEPSSLWLNFRGENLFRNGSAEDAIESFTKAIIADPGLAVALNNIGVCYWSSGETEKAKKYFLKALEIDQNDRDTVLNSIKVNVALSKNEEARKICGNYLKNNVDDEEISRIFNELRNPEDLTSEIKVFTPAKAYWNQRNVLKSMRDRIHALSDAVDNKTDLWPYQLSQLMAAALEFKPEVIIELGRGKGNSTCGFTEVANHLRRQGHRCEVVSLCISEDWEQTTQWKVLDNVEGDWFEPLRALRGNILTFDYESILKGAKRCLVFWDAHGFDVAECVLGRILPKIKNMDNLIIMHDLSDARYIPPEASSYKEQKLWRGNDWSGPRVRLGNIDSSVEQAIAIVDFTSRNRIPFDSADHSINVEIGGHPVKMKDMQDVLGDLFNLGAHWFWFTLNDAKGPLTFPNFQAPIMNDHYEINIFDQMQIMGVSLKNAVLSQPDMVEVIKRVNRYLKMGKPKLAAQIVEKEIGNLNEKDEILAKLGKAGSDENRDTGQIQIMGISLKADVIETAKRVNHYIEIGNSVLASKIVKNELGHLNESSEILAKIRKKKMREVCNRREN